MTGLGADRRQRRLLLGIQGMELLAFLNDRWQRQLPAFGNQPGSSQTAQLRQAETLAGQGGMRPLLLPGEQLPEGLLPAAAQSMFCIILQSDPDPLIGFRQFTAAAQHGGQHMLQHFPHAVVIIAGQPAAQVQTVGVYQRRIIQPCEYGAQLIGRNFCAVTGVQYHAQQQLAAKFHAHALPRLILVAFFLRQRQVIKSAA